MNLIGKIVMHKSWGQGTIINQTKTRITVKFDSCGIGERVFIYPDIFKNLLKCIDNATESYIQNLLHNQNSNSNGHSTTHLQITNVNHSSSSDSTSVKHCCSKFEIALKEEISYLKNNAGKHWQLFDGKEIEQDRKSVV